MITVSILINGQPIYTRSAVNVGNTAEAAIGSKERRCRYECDDGSVINHWKHRGAIELAKLMLDTIIEVKQSNDDRSNGN